MLFAILKLKEEYEKYMRARSLPVGSQNRQTALNYGFVLKALFAAVAVLVVLIPFVASAATTISQGYTTTEDLSLGSIVSLKQNTADQVVAAVASNADSILGVVINSDSSLLSLTNDNKEQVQVATSGTVPVIVSDINGEIHQGDHITASPLKGVGMKATANVRIVGIAQGGMKNPTKQTYKDKSGKEHSVTLGEVPVIVNVAYFFKEPEKTVVPTALQNIANALAGKTVNTLPIVLSSAVFFIMLIIVSSIVYSMIKSSIISVGRNPMSQSAVYRDLIQLSTLVLAILATGLISIYFILTRL
jgi:hypothetical protein